MQNYFTDKEIQRKVKSLYMGEFWVGKKTYVPSILKNTRVPRLGIFIGGLDRMDFFTQQRIIGKALRYLLNRGEIFPRGEVGWVGFSAGQSLIESVIDAHYRDYTNSYEHPQYPHYRNFWEVYFPTQGKYTPTSVYYSTEGHIISEYPVQLDYPVQMLECSSCGKSFIPFPKEKKVCSVACEEKEVVKNGNLCENKKRGI